MSDRPIIFSAPMVRALLDGQKTQTRRFQFDARGRLTTWGRLAEEWQRGKRDQRIWVRENFAMGFDHDDHDMRIGDEPKPFYAASYDGMRWYDPDHDELRDEPRWKPSIHMPRWASRLTLTVTDVRVQRLQEISEDDALAEGVSIPATPDGKALVEIWPNSPLSYAKPRQASETADDFIARALTARTLFAALWEKLHGANTWTANPWVVSLTFTVAQRNIDAMEKAA